MGRPKKTTMADETDEITDLEAFHSELQDGVNSVRQLVAAWMPKRNTQASSSRASTSGSGSGSNGSYAFSAAASSVQARGRPERLGIGASMPKQTTSGVNLSNPDSKEAKLMTAMMGKNNKRKGTDDRTSQVSSLAQPSTSKAAMPAAPASDDDDEDSRAKSISVKKTKPGAANGFFHDKPKKQHKPAQQISHKAAASNTFAKPSLPLGSADTRSLSGTPQPLSRTASPPPSPTRLSEVKPPYAIPPTLTGAEEGEDCGVEEDGSFLDEGASVVTSQTDSALRSNDLADPNDAEKKKRKRKKKKKQQKAAVEGTVSGGDGGSQSKVNDRLFGDSVLS